jgi:hypothetical protein
MRNLNQVIPLTTRLGILEWVPGEIRASFCGLLALPAPCRSFTAPVLPPFSAGRFAFASADLSLTSRRAFLVVLALRSVRHDPDQGGHRGGGGQSQGARHRVRLCRFALPLSCWAAQCHHLLFVDGVRAFALC